MKLLLKVLVENTKGSMISDDLDDAPPFIQEMIGRMDPAKMPSVDHVASFFGPVLSYNELRDGRLVICLESRYPEAK